LKHSLGSLLVGLGSLESESASLEVTGVTADSRRVRAGDLFVAVRGHAVDGHSYLTTAIESGARAVVVEDASLVPDGIPTLVVASTRDAFGSILRRFHDHPDRSLDVVAVTGTNGKTTVGHLVRDLLNAVDRRCGLVGTIRYDDLREDVPAPLTTPGAEDLIALLATMRANGGVAVSMEASSHALDQRRLGGIEVDVAAFTNITRDHLDYHGDHEAYVAAKRRLLDHLTGDDRVKDTGRVVVFVDDPVLAGLDWPKGAITVGRDPSCTVHVHGVEFESGTTTLEVTVGGARARFESALVGGYNAANLSVVIGVGHALGLDVDTMVDVFPRLRPVPGRLEPVELEGGPLVLIDYAHTADGMRSALEAVAPLTRGTVHLVFGCGGDRDRGKRPEMARAALEGAGRIVFTVDNPRTEDPEQIFADTAVGFAAAPDRVHRVDDRGAALADVLEAASPGDVVLVAGKGHETYQIFGTEKTPWDDRIAIREAWARIGGAA